MNLSFKHNLALMLLTAAGTLTFSACSDNSTSDTAPSAVDPKQWNLDANMDTSVKPGDDFARYCWGKWYDAQGDAPKGGFGTFAESQEELNKMVGQLEQKDMKLIKRELASLGEDEAGLAEIRQRIQKLKQLRHASSKDVAAELGSFLASGKFSTIYCYLDVASENCYYRVFLGTNENVSDNVPTTDNPQDSLIYADWLVRLGMNEEDAASVLKDGLSQDYDTSVEALTSDGNAEHKAVGEAFCQALGIDAKYLQYGTNDAKYSSVDGIGKFIEENATHIVDMMICFEASDIVLVSRKAFDDFCQSNGFSEDEFISFTVEQLLMYAKNKEFCDKFCTEEMRNKIFDMMEDMRTTFASRIDQLTWMSATTKQAAREKLAAMKCYALYPDSWMSEGLPELKGKSFYEDINILKKTYANLQKAFLSHNPREDHFNYLFIVNPDSPSYLVNCSYYPYNNTVHIYAPFAMSPFYSSENSDATLYAIGAVLGHEMTHGFDNNGSLYGPKGEDINWWTVADKQEYDERTKLLVDCYNHLPGYIYCPGSCFANGTKTLGENIADLGGVEIALQAYTAKLEKQGYYGDELKKQQKRFFQAYANLWRSKYSNEYYVNRLLTNEHGNSYVRVLGVTMNCDRWYELYNVQWGDKYYLKPEKRTHIW